MASPSLKAAHAFRRHYMYCIRRPTTHVYLPADVFQGGDLTLLLSCGGQCSAKEGRPNSHYYSRRGKKKPAGSSWRLRHGTVRKVRRRCPWCTNASNTKWYHSGTDSRLVPVNKSLGTWSALPACSAVNSLHWASLIYLYFLFFFGSCWSKNYKYSYLDTLFAIQSIQCKVWEIDMFLRQQYASFGTAEVGAKFNIMIDNPTLPFSKKRL